MSMNIFRKAKKFEIMRIQGRLSKKLLVGWSDKVDTSSHQMVRKPW